MKSLEKNIVPIVVAGAIVLAASKLLSKKDSDNKGTTDEPKDVPNVPQGSPYADKVRALQKALGVGVDGDAGKETNGALENLFTSPPTKIPYDLSKQQNYPSLKARGKGAVSPDNVDFYINAIKTKTYPSALYTSNQAVQGDAKTIKAAYEKGGVLRTKRVIIVKGVVKDTARNVYVSTGKEYKYYANVTFITPEAFSRSRVKIVDITSLGNLVVQVSPATIQYPINQPVYNLLIKPSDLIVSN